MIHVSFCRLPVFYTHLPDIFCGRIDITGDAQSGGGHQGLHTAFDHKTVAIRRLHKYLSLLRLLSFCLQAF